jgi:hypothetical protein
VRGTYSMHLGTWHLSLGTLSPWHPGTLAPVLK